MISVNELVALPSLGLHFLAGVEGGRRLVSWAHACDLADPWNWIAAGDLVMTTGPGIPRDPSEQTGWLEKVAGTRAAALVVAPGPQSPSLGTSMLERAEALGFPVLAAQYNLQFISLARAVIESSLDAERRRVAAIKRIYEVNGRSAEEGSDLDGRLSALENASGWTLRIWDYSEEALLCVGDRARRAGFTGAPEHGDEVSRLYGDPAIRLVAAAREGQQGDGALLAHVVGLLTMEFRYRVVEKDSLRSAGQGLLSGLIDESITPAAVWPELRRRGMEGRVAVVCWSAAAADEGAVLDHRELHRREWWREVFPLLMAQGDQLLGVIPADESTAARAAAALGPNVVAGVSSDLTVNSSVPELVRQARLSASRAAGDGRRAAVYGDSPEEMDFFPSSIDGVRILVRRVLGRVIDYDRDNGTELVISLRVLLGNDGNWSRSAEQLHIHRQTLVYRMNKVAELCGLHPTTTQGGALTWFALESARRAGVDVSEVTSG